MEKTVSFQLLSFLLTSVYLLKTCLAMNISTDQSCLLALKSHIISDPYHILSTNWSSSTSVCNWIGVTCGSRHQRVTVLNISDMGFSGTIPPQLGNLSFLVALDLSYNDFHGEIPPEFSHLWRLRFIDLSYNNFIGEIPIGITTLPSLKLFSVGYIKLLNGSNVLSNFNISTLEILDLRKAGLTSDFPSDLCRRLPRLQILALDRNMLSGEIPRNMSECSKLQILSLFRNNFVGTIPRELGNLQLLQYLDLSNNNLEGVIPEEVGNLQDLKNLSLFLNNFNGPIPVVIFNISTLRTISLTNNNISGNLPSTIGYWLPNLIGILLGGNNINGVIPVSVSNLSNLITLDLGENEFTGPIPESLGKLSFLKSLHLDTNPFTSDFSFITSLANCKYLKVLALSDIPLNAMLPKSIGNLSSLQTFDASNCNLKGHIPNEIGNLRNLSTLGMEGNNFIGIVPTTITSLKNLQRLSLGANRMKGPFPIVLCELPKLGLLNLSRNQLWGSIPSCLGNVTSLREVYLDSNNFASIPSSLWTLKDILVVNLSSNFLNDSLPLEVGHLKAAIFLDLSWNQISGNIPSTLGGLQKLIQLSLAHNRIEGSIPETFGGLVDLKKLDLSYNNMSGVIPKSLEALKQLDFFNVSFNRLHGEIPSGGPFVHLPYQSFMSNEGLCGNPQKHVPVCPSNSKNHSNSKKKRLTWIVIASSVISVTGIISAIVFILMRRRGKTVNAEDERLPEVAPQRISYYELQRATQGFDENNLLGSGSFGSVYKGTLADGMIVAVKVFNVQMEGSFQTFNRECEILRKIRHRNLSKIISSCCNLDFKALILEYMPNQSLDKLLYSRDHSLNIMQRLNIMADVAYALEYLHHGCSIPIIHCDLKPSNVLLDKDMVGHLTDFGIAKLLTEEESIAHTKTFATIGYIAPGESLV
ncbi:unnamed protein product [Withania somnifera]